MALVKCPDCGAEHSDEAPACPKCAKPVTSPAHDALRGSITATVMGVAGAVLALVGAFLPFVQNPFASLSYFNMDAYGVFGLVLSVDWLPSPSPGTEKLLMDGKVFVALAAVGLAVVAARAYRLGFGVSLLMAALLAYDLHHEMTGAHRGSGDIGLGVGVPVLLLGMVSFATGTLRGAYLGMKAGPAPGRPDKKRVAAVLATTLVVVGALALWSKRGDSLDPGLHGTQAGPADGAPSKSADRPERTWDESPDALAAARSNASDAADLFKRIRGASETEQEKWSSGVACKDPLVGVTGKGTVQFIDASKRRLVLRVNDGLRVNLLVRPQDQAKFAVVTNGQLVSFFGLADRCIEDVLAVKADEFSVQKP